MSRTKCAIRMSCRESIGGRSGVAQKSRRESCRESKGSHPDLKSGVERESDGSQVGSCGLGEMRCGEKTCGVMQCVKLPCGENPRGEIPSGEMACGLNPVPGRAGVRSRPGACFGKFWSSLEIVPLGVLDFARNRVWKVLESLISKNSKIFPK